MREVGADLPSPSFCFLFLPTILRRPYCRAVFLIYYPLLLFYIQKKYTHTHTLLPEVKEKITATIIIVGDE